MTTKTKAATVTTAIGAFAVFLILAHDYTTPIPSWARNAYYTSPAGGGTGRNPGTRISLAQAQHLAGPGDFVVLAPGDYSSTPFAPDSSGSPGRPVTYIGDMTHPELVIMPGFTTTRHDLRFRGVHFVRTVTLGHSNTTASRVVLTRCEMPALAFWGAQDCKVEQSLIGYVPERWSTVYFGAANQYGGEMVDPPPVACGVAERDTLDGCTIHLGNLLTGKGFLMRMNANHNLIRRCRVDGTLAAGGEIAQGRAIYNSNSNRFQDCRWDLPVIAGYSGPMPDATWLRDSSYSNVFLRDTIITGGKIDLTRTGKTGWEPFTYGNTWDRCVYRAAGGLRIQAIGNTEPNIVTECTFENTDGGTTLTLQGGGKGEDPLQVWRNWTFVADTFSTTGPSTIMLDHSGYLPFKPAPSFVWRSNRHEANTPAVWDGKTLARVVSENGIEIGSTSKP